MALPLLGSGPEGSSTTRRSAVKAVAAAVVLLAALVAGVVLGRLSVAPNTTPATEEQVVEGPIGEDPGPTGSVRGVPVGYARSAEGAVAAATGYTLTLADKRTFNPAWRDAAYRVIAAPDAYPALVESVRGSYTRIADRVGLDDAAAYDGSIQATTVPLGYRVDAYHSERATVTVWSAGWLTRPRGTQLPLRARTMTFELAWVDADWKIVGVSANEPLDPPGVSVPPTLAMQNHMATFTPYHWAPQRDR